MNNFSQPFGRSALRLAQSTAIAIRMVISLGGLWALFTALPLAAQNATIAYDVPPGVVGNQAIAGLGVGNDFNVIYPITVSELGVFNSGTNGIQGTAELTVQLFERNGHAGMLLQTLTFDATSPGQRINGNLFKPLPTPLTLLPGSYSIVAFGFDPANLEASAGAAPYSGSPPPWTENDGGGLIRFVGSSRYGYDGVGHFPKTVDQGPANRYAAGTFIFSATTLPSPPWAADYAALTAGVTSFPIEDIRHMGSLAVMNDGSFPVLVEHGGNRLVLEAAGYYNNNPAAARAVVFAHAQWEHSTGDSRITLFENAIKWAARKSNPADIVLGVTTNLPTNDLPAVDVNYLQRRGYTVIPLSLLPDPNDPWPTMDVLVADWHTHYNQTSLAQIQQFTAAGGGLVMGVLTRHIIYPKIRPSFGHANDILRPFGLAYRSSLAVPADYGFTNIQSVPYPDYFSAIPAAQMLHADRLGQIQMDNLSKAIALNTINYASAGQPDLLNTLMSIYTGITNTGAAQLPSGENISFVDVVTLAGAQATSNRLGAWTTNRNDLVAADRRGSVEYDFSLPTADLYKLRIEATQNKPFNPSDTCLLRLTLDGHSLGQHALAVQPGAVSALECWTPYLLPGPHSLRILWDNAKSGTALELVAVHVQTGLGASDNGSGLKDWVAQLVQTQSGMDLTNSVIQSYVSPVCLEGRDPYPALMQVQIQGADDRTSSGTPAETSDHRWYLNVPLSAWANSQTVLEATYQNGALTETHQLQWLPINILTITNPSIKIRSGDSLLLTVAPPSAAKGPVSIAYGTNTYTGNSSQAIACKFPVAGAYTVAGTYTTPNGISTTGSILVDVVAQSLTNSPPCWVGMERTWDLPGVAPEVVLGADPRLFIEETATLTNNGERFSLLADANEPRSITARIGETGVILGSTQARGFHLWSGSDAYTRIVQRYPDGSQLVEMMVISSPVLPDVTFEIDTTVGGITFDDGTTTKILTPADFDGLGRCRVRFIRPANARTSVCHSITAWQGSTVVGYLQ